VSEKSKLTPAEKKRAEATRWQRIFLAATGLCALTYLLNILLSEIRSGNAWGLGYGTAATVLMVGAALFGWRRRSMSFVSRRGLGRSRVWLYFHIYGGTLFLLLLLMHTGFRLPRGAMTQGLWLLSLWTALSGVIGLVLQKWIPRALASGLSIEVNYDRIPELIDQIRERSEKLAAGCSDTAQRLYRRKIAVALAGPHRSLMYFIDITGGIQSRLKELRYLQRLQEGDERQRLDELERLFRAKLEIDAHYTLQQALRFWLYLHVPMSLLLLAFVAVHIFMVWYY